MCQNPGVPLSGVDVAACARWLAQVADHPGDHADLFLERREELELPPGERRPGLRVVREQGLAVRLLRDRQTYLASADRLDGGAFADALRRAARALPATSLSEPALAVPAWPEPAGGRELVAFAEAIRAGLRASLVAFPLALRVRAHRRWVQVVGARLLAPSEQEAFYSVVAETPWGALGRLLIGLDDAAAAALVAALVARFQARDAAPPERARQPLLLAPRAAAVFLHEAIAHTLEADLLALGGRPEAAVGVELAPPWVSVIDDPAAAPPSLRRVTDDEGLPVVRRWLLRGGRVEQPLADTLWARHSPQLLPGAGWRGSRHEAPLPRSRHLELAPGDFPLAALLRRAEGGLFVEEVERGRLDPHTGELVLDLPFARRIRSATVAEPVGRCRLRGRVAELLAGISAVGSDVETAGAGWCAKGGQMLPVWARAGSLLLDRVEVGP